VPAPDLLARLIRHYHRVNRAKFKGALPLDYRIVMNPLLRRLTGRITYGQRLIEISAYHVEQYGMDDALQTLEHELLHLFLHVHGRPSGHTAEFKQLAKTLDIRVYHANAYPRNRPSLYRYVYECPSCARLVFRQRPTAEGLACGICCRERTDGQWDKRFELRLRNRVRLA
jgi:SprT-like protein